MIIKLLAKLFPLFNNTVRVSEIRSFVEDEPNENDGNVFSQLIRRYELVDGLSPEDLKNIQLHLLHKHINHLFEDCENKLNSMSRGVSLNANMYTSNTHCTLLDWLSSEKGHYDPEESFKLLCNALESYSDSLSVYSEGKLESSMRRLMSPTSFTMKYLIAALANHKYEMEFEDW